MNKVLENLSKFVDCQTLSLESQYEALSGALLNTPNELCDYVDGFQIIEEHEYNFTVKELWDEINAPNELDDVFGMLGNVLKP